MAQERFCGRRDTTHLFNHSVPCEMNLLTKSIILRLLDHEPGDKVGLIVLDNTKQPICVPTPGHSDDTA